MKRKTKKFLVRVGILSTLFFWALVLVALPGLMLAMVALQPGGR